MEQELNSLKEEILFWAVVDMQYLIRKIYL